MPILHALKNLRRARPLSAEITPSFSPYLRLTARYDSAEKPSRPRGNPPQLHLLHFDAADRKTEPDRQIDLTDAGQDFSLTVELNSLSEDTTCLSYIVSSFGQSVTEQIDLFACIAEIQTSPKFKVSRGLKAELREFRLTQSPDNGIAICGHVLREPGHWTDLRISSYIGSQDAAFINWKNILSPLA